MIKEEDKEPLKNFEKSQNLERIRITGLYNHNDDTGRWSLSDIKLGNINSLKKLKELEISGISMADLKEIKSLQNLKKFHLFNPTVITKTMNSDEGTIDPAEAKRLRKVARRAAAEAATKKKKRPNLLKAKFRIFSPNFSSFSSM